ncbi:MAG: FtsW/RodA/SpoVE family cell cycle protein [Ruminococcus sp.]|nr:FtsW/RodA/SpoVE family cell cycle protein [Ruminococcus sp.]
MNFQVFLDVGIVALRAILPIYAVVIVYQCFASARRHRRPEKPLVTLEIEATGQKVPVLFWENSIGRSKGSDICVADMAVSRDHCVLLRRQEGWFVSDIGSKFGTFVNGEPAKGRTKVNIDDEITVGNTTFTLKRGDEYQRKLRPSWFFSKASDKGSLQPYKLMLLITFFQLFMAVEACFSNDRQDFLPLAFFGGLAVIEWAFFCISSYAFNRVNFEMEALALFLSGIGVMIGVRQNTVSAPDAGFRMALVQLISMTVGIILFSFIVKFIEKPDRVDSLRMYIMIAAVILLGINIVFGTVTNGAANWIRLGPITVQPSEFVKVAFIFVGASALDHLQTKRNFIEFIAFSAICVGALAFMGDFGTALIFFLTFLLIAFMRSGDFKTIILALVAAVFAVILVLNIKPYVADRFATWGHAWEYADDNGYQQVNAMIYTASGGLIGVGLGNGYLKYLAASESDLVFGIVSEEMGLVVGFTIAAAIVALCFYARAITTRSRSTFYSITANCAAGMFVVQAALNILGAMDILPLTGVTLPYISAGGSSMIACWGLIAFIKAADERTYAAKRRPVAEKADDTPDEDEEIYPGTVMIREPLTREAAEKRGGRR